MTQNTISIVMPYTYKKGLRATTLRFFKNNIYTLKIISALQKRKIGAALRLQHEPPLFGTILIETNSNCNNDCSFCPANIHYDKREVGIINDNLYMKILRDLVDLDYKGTICLYCNNEPLIDKKIVERIRLARRMLPDTQIKILTNGILLNYDKFLEINDSGLTELRINCYNDDLVLNPNIRDLLHRIEEERIELKTDVVVLLRKKTEVLANKCGNSPNMTGLQAARRKLFCLMPFTFLNVNYAGDVPLCCNDAYYEGVQGNVAQESIKNVWRNSNFDSIRQRLLRHDRGSIELCSRCDYFELGSRIDGNSLLDSILKHKALAPHYDTRSHTSNGD